MSQCSSNRLFYKSIDLWNRDCSFVLTMPTDSPAPSESELREISARRRFLRGGLAAGPVVATIASRPVLGATVCTQASMMGSVAASGRQAVPVTLCNGLTPEQWEAIPTQWPAPYVGGVNAPACTESVQTVAAPAPVTTTSTIYQGSARSGIT